MGVFNTLKNQLSPEKLSTAYENYKTSYQKLAAEEHERRMKYVGYRPLPIVESGDWPATLAGGEFEVLNNIYNQFLTRQNAMVQLCFKRLGVYSFGGFGASADTEGNAAWFDDGGGDMTFDALSKIKQDELQNYMLIPINPQDISVNYRVNVNSHRTMFFSELATLSGIKLRRFVIKSFFPYRMDSRVKFGTEPVYRPQDYIRWITECMDNKLILAFKAFGQLAEPLPYMKCFIESFDTTLKSNGDVEYSLSICEYIDYRDTMDTRMFAMDGETLIVSEDTEKRKDGKIGLGDLVYVTKGLIYSDRLKRNPLKLRNVVDSFFRYPPNIVTTKLFNKKYAQDWYSRFGVINPAQDNGAAIIYNLANRETIDFIAEMIKAKTSLDPTEVWMVVGGDYFSKYHGTREDIESVMTSSIQQIGEFILDFSPQSLTHNVKIRSMKDNRIGWVDFNQMQKVSL